MNPTYTQEQKDDINERTAKAIEMLKELNLYPQAQVTKGRITTNDGQELFADRVQPFLADTKYIAKGDVYEEVTPEIVGAPTE